jgi:glycosyltransferase domain-containing protein
MITLCVPTKNRPEFLGRLLRYYASVRYPHWIFIGDSSDSEHAASNQEHVARLGGTLQIVYRHYPGCSSCDCIERLTESVSTPYCAYVGDDDFLCAHGIERAIQFLERHAEYTAAHGRGAIFQTEGGGAYGAVTSVRRYPQAIVEAATASARLTEFFTSSYYALVYSVHRTDIWRAMFKGVGLLQGTTNSNIFKDELIAACVSVIRGKVKGLDGLYLLRHAHEAIYKHPRVYDWVTNHEWFPSYECFRARLTEELMRQDGIRAEEAEDVIRQVFWPYLARVLMSGWERWRTPTPPQVPSRIRQFLKRVPGLRRAVLGLRAMKRQWQDELSLPALLRRSSRYHEDFMSLYRVITTPPNGLPDVRVVAGRRGHVGLAEVPSHG